MPSQVLTDVQNYYGSAGWTGSAANRQIGANYVIRLRFTTALNNMGDITSISTSWNKVSSVSMVGSLYVTTNAALTPKDTASMYYFGGYTAPTGTGTKTFTVSSLNGANFKSGIGTASEWYLIITTTETSIRYWTTITSRSSWTVSHNEPYSIHTRVAGVMKGGEPYARAAGVQKRGVSHVRMTGVWKKGR